MMTFSEKFLLCIAGIVAGLISTTRLAHSDCEQCVATLVGGEGTGVCFGEASSSTSTEPGQCENQAQHCAAKPCKLNYSFDIELDPECEGPGISLCTGVCHSPGAPGTASNPLHPCFGPDNCTTPSNHITGSGTLNARCGENATVYVNQAGSAIYWAILICGQC